jgi:hypothetical protein
MGTKTALSSAIFGAVLMFFLGSNIPLFSSMLGLTRRASFSSKVHIPSSLGSGASNPVAAAAAALASGSSGSGASGNGGDGGGAGGGSGGGGGGGKPSKPLTKNDLAAEVLRGVLVDDDRKLCSVRYPEGLTITQDQKDYINDNRYFIVITLRNNEELLHHALYELLNVIARLGPRHVFVSVFENNSKDKTPQFLALFTDLLKLAGVAHNLVSTFTLARELEALKKAGKLDPAAAAPGSLAAGSTAGSGRRLLEGAGGAKEEEEEEALSALWLQEAVETELMAQLSGEDGVGSSSSNSNSNSNSSSDAYGEWWPEDEWEEEEKEHEEERVQALKGVYQALFRPSSRGVGAAPVGDGIFSSSTSSSSSSSSRSNSSGAARGRLLGEEEERDMIALLTEGKWTGNRIEFLARVRNRSIRPLFSRKEKYDKLIVMNDAIFCAEDVLRLALHECVTPPLPFCSPPSLPPHPSHPPFTPPRPLPSLPPPPTLLPQQRG